MKSGLPAIVVFFALAATAGPRSYRPGVLKKIETGDIAHSIPLRSTPGQDFSIPFPLGIEYRFQIQSDMILYVSECWSRSKKNYDSEWVINDPVEFRIEKDRVFVKRAGKGELHLALISRWRVLPSSIEPLPRTSTRHDLPECR
jgi:hypothetical protein